jgi:hypothetical protein
MNPFLYLLLLFFLVGCAGSPPKPVLPQGEYRPINKVAVPAQTDVFHFAYEGDIGGALSALKGVTPQLTVLPAIGTPVPLAVRIRLQATMLADALHAIDAQGGTVADVVRTTTTAHIEHPVFLRYKAPTDVAPGTRKRKKPQ